MEMKEQHVEHKQEEFKISELWSFKSIDCLEEIMQQLLNLAGFVYKGYDYSSLRSFLLKILDFSFVF